MDLLDGREGAYKIELVASNEGDASSAARHLLLILGIYARAISARSNTRLDFRQILLCINRQAALVWVHTIEDGSVGREESVLK